MRRCCFDLTSLSNSKGQAATEVLAAWRRLTLERHALALLGQGCVHKMERY